MKTIRPSRYEDLPELLTVFDEARQQMRAGGNMRQWPDGRPSAEQIKADIQRGVSYVVEEQGLIVGTFALIPGEEPTYRIIYEGHWLDDTQPYATIHRIAKRHTAHGIFNLCLDFCLRQHSNLRIDTHADNLVMQHLIEARGFSYCGIIHLANGEERLAYQLTGTEDLAKR